MKYSALLNIWLLIAISNAVLISTPYQGMHTFEVMGVPIGYLSFILGLIVLSVCSKFRIPKLYFMINIGLLGIIAYGVISLLWIVDYKS